MVTGPAWPISPPMTRESLRRVGPTVAMRMVCSGLRIIGLSGPFSWMTRAEILEFWRTSARRVGPGDLESRP